VSIIIIFILQASLFLRELLIPFGSAVYVALFKIEGGDLITVLAAIVSSLRSKPLPDKLVMFGEVGLAGKIRPVQRGQERLKEAAKLGFTQAIVPAANQPKQKIAGMEIHPVRRLDEAIGLFREG
jgi:predicted ATP-dependent serine protease